MTTTKCKKVITKTKVQKAILKAIRINYPNIKTDVINVTKKMPGSKPSKETCIEIEGAGFIIIKKPYDVYRIEYYGSDDTFINLFLIAEPINYAEASLIRCTLAKLVEAISFELFINKTKGIDFFE